MLEYSCDFCRTKEGNVKIYNDFIIQTITKDEVGKEQLSNYKYDICDYCLRDLIRKGMFIKG